MSELHKNPEDDPCEECGSKEWKRDEARGETWCVLCGCLKSQFEIDYGKTKITLAVPLVVNQPSV